MKVPTVHINGTHRDSLLEQQTEACAALTRALDAMRAAAPNARDFYVQGPEAFEQAVAEHASRVKAVDRVRMEHVAIAEDIADQGIPWRPIAGIGGQERGE